MGDGVKYVATLAIVLICACGQEDNTPTCMCQPDGDWVLREIALINEQYENGALTIEQGEGYYDLARTDSSGLYAWIEEYALVSSTSCGDTLWLHGLTNYFYYENLEQILTQVSVINDSVAVTYSEDCNVLTWVLDSGVRVWDRQ